ncbi:hypothetical protein MKX08_009255 [Trichoderma sp. CBMAI-0020]|nr:hypothetical protein MKX08_009255 [Trichoderma sp. CBMAI-0020]WOD45726.1 hypothetical protein [Trichoderma atroviride]
MPQFSDQHTSTRPLTYIIIPILAFFAVFSIVIFFFCIRRRRARDRETTIELGRGRPNPSGGADSHEGLNELGEAPPPYLVRKLSAEGEVVAGERPTELRDLEEGRRPPVYISEPPPAVTTDSRRTEA